MTWFWVFLIVVNSATIVLNVLAWHWRQQANRTLRQMSDETDRIIRGLEDL